jgi:hypothetical protein
LIAAAHDADAAQEAAATTTRRYIEMNRIRKAIAATVLSLGAVAGAALGTSAPTSAAGVGVSYGAPLVCVSGAAGGGAPDLSTLSSNVWWQAQLYGWDGYQWQYLNVSDWYYKSNSGALYSTWTDYSTGAVSTYAGWTGLTYNAYYAVRNVVWIDGYSYAEWSLTNSGSYYCQT